MEGAGTFLRTGVVGSQLLAPSSSCFTPGQVSDHFQSVLARTLELEKNNTKEGVRVLPYEVKSQRGNECRQSLFVHASLILKTA